MTEKALTEIGLSNNEAKIYTCLLRLGQTTITKVAQETKLHRSNVYDSMKKLIDKGLASYVKNDTTTFYEASNPASLLRIIREKENKIQAIMPQLQLAKKLADSKGEATIYEGVPAFMRILYNFLEYKEPIYVWGIPKIAPEIMKTKIPHFHKKRLGLKIPMYHIYNFNAQDRIRELNSMEFTEAKFLPKHFDSQVSTNVCGDEVVLTLWTNTVLAIQIKHPLVACVYKKYFELLWESSKKKI